MGGEWLGTASPETHVAIACLFGTVLSVPGRIWEQAFDIAVDQYGFITFEDLRGMGADPVRLRRWNQAGKVARVGHGIYRFPQIPATALDPYMLATLWPSGRGVLSHDTALELHELCDVNPEKIHITIPSGYRPRRDGGEHYIVRRAKLAEETKTYHEGIPIVTPALAVAQGLEAGVPAHLMRQALDRGERRGHFRPDEIQRLWSRAGRSKRRATKSADEKARATAFANALAEANSGLRWGVFLDDTGPAGSRTGEPGVPRDLVGIVAVLVPPERMALMRAAMHSMKQTLRAEGGEAEFHAAHIMNGDGPYRSMAVARRIALCTQMGSILRQVDARVVAQAIDGAKQGLVATRIRATPPPKWLREHDPKHQAFWGALLRTAGFLREEGASAVVQADLGIVSNTETVRTATRLDDVFVGGMVASADSKEEPGIQLADFAAYFLNRSAVTRWKETPGTIDLCVELEIASRLPEVVSGAERVSTDFSKRAGDR